MRQDLYQFLHLMTIVTAGFSCVLGGVVLFGWYSHNVTLIQVSPHFVPMQYNTALEFLICGIGGLSFKYKRLRMVCGGIAVTISCLTLVQHIFGVNLNIDQLFLEHYVTVKTPHPGRMAPNTALCFGLTGLALLIMSHKPLTVGILGSIVIALGSVAFMGYLSGVETAYGWGNFTQMAVHTALGCMTLGTGVLVYAWRTGAIEENRQIPRWFVYPTGIGMTTIAVALWQAIQVQLGGEQFALPFLVLGAGILSAVLFVIIIRLTQILWDHTQTIKHSNLLLKKEIIEHKQAKIKLQQAKKVAEIANKAKSTFLANTTHELRTPLNGILGYTQILKRSQGLTTLQQDGLEVIHSSAELLLTLIDDLLEISKIETGKIELHPKEFSFPHFLESIVGIIRMQAQQKNVRFLYEKDDDLPIAIEADETRLRQILLNLLRNAVKFTESGGKVTLRVHKHHALLYFEVSDTGIGMHPEQLAKIFQPFEKVLDRWSDGMGIGLTISQQLVKLMAGEIQVTSEKGQGSTFWFEVPLIQTIYPMPTLITPPLSETEFILPPFEELEKIYKLAMLGLMQEAEEQVNVLETLDEKYLPFLNQLREFALNFDDEQMIVFLEKFIVITNYD